MRPRPHSCIIGAGCSGFSAAKALQDLGLSFDILEMSDVVGGNWAYRNSNGHSACYESLHIDTSKHRMAFADFPIPEDLPDFPHHSEIFAYFNSYVDHFGLRSKIEFETCVEEVRPLPEDRWSVRLRSRDGVSETREYDAVLVGNGHHWKPRFPKFEGQETFTGVQMHAHAYLNPFEPETMHGKRIVVVGMGNSAMDISSELSQRTVAKRLWVSARRGVWILPKYIHGRVADKATMPGWMPLRLQRWIARPLLKRVLGRMEDYGLPKPDHEPLEAHPSVSGEFLTRVGCGDILPKPNIQRFEGDEVEFVDGTRERVDVVIYATGYDVSFPFLGEDMIRPVDNYLPLFKRIWSPQWPTLLFLGLAQPLPTLVNLAEQQMKLIGSYLAGNYVLPDEAEMEATIAREERQYIGHFYDSARHRMQIDFNKYVWDLKREIRRGGSRSGADSTG
jgi:hypothetical protein